MRSKYVLPAVILMLSAPALAADAPAASPEDQLRAMLQGYTAGPPQRCLATSRIKKMKIVDQTALVFTASGALYVNRPVNAAALRNDLIPAFEPDAGRLCSGAQVSLQTSSDFWNIGAVRLTDWIPYRREGKD